MTNTGVSCSHSGNLEESFKTFSNDCCFPVRMLWELANYGEGEKSNGGNVFDRYDIA